MKRNITFVTAEVKWNGTTAVVVSRGLHSRTSRYYGDITQASAIRVQRLINNSKDTYVHFQTFDDKKGVLAVTAKI